MYLCHMKTFKLLSDRNSIFIKRWYGWKLYYKGTFESDTFEICQNLKNNGHIVFNYRDTLKNDFIRFAEMIEYGKHVKSTKTMSEIYDIMFKNKNNSNNSLI